MTNIGTEGDRLVKQFVSLLKGYAFDWYTNLKANFIDSWKKKWKEGSLITFIVFVVLSTYLNSQMLDNKNIN